MAALAQGRVGRRTGAGGEGAAVELAEEADARLRIAEAEAGAGLVGGIGWCRSDGGDRRSRSVNGPGETGCGAQIAGRILGLDREGVAARS